MRSGRTVDRDAAAAPRICLRPIELAAGNAMNNPYRMLENWPHLGAIKPGAAIGIVPDGKGGVWLQHRSVPAILHIDPSGNILKQFDVTFSSSHGFCQDQDGNFWAADSGPFNDSPEAGVKGNQVFKFDQNGKLLLTLGKAGVGKAGTDTFLQPSACRATPDGNILIADGHWPRPTDDAAGRRSPGLVHARWEVHQGVRPARAEAGRVHGAARSRVRFQGPAVRRRPLEQPHADLRQGHERGRCRGRSSDVPAASGFSRTTRCIVSDSESNNRIGGPDDAPEGGGNAIRNPGWKNGIRIGSAKDGSLKYFIEGTRPEGLAADELGNIFGGLTAGCDVSKSGGCLQKFVPVKKSKS